MSQVAVGTVNEITTKPWEDRETGENITLYSFTLEGQRKFFRTGTTPPPVERGQNVRFVYNGQKVDLESIETVEASDVPAPKPQAATTGAGRSSTGGQTKGGYWDAKEARDIAKDKRYQEVSEPRMALSVGVAAAADVVVAALQNDALSFGNTAKSKREGMLAEFVKTIALDLAVFIHEAPAQLAAAKEGVAEAGDDGE